MKWLKDKLYLIAGALVVFALVYVFIGACMEGYSVMVTQERIDDSYRIHR